MISLFRAMSEEEFDKTTDSSLSFLKKSKFFGNIDFVRDRVLDGDFAFSRFKPEKYSHFVEVQFDEKYLEQFQKLNEKEFLLNIRKSNFSYRVIKWGECSQENLNKAITKPVKKQSLKRRF